ncbi:MAG: 3-deoxy-7-phosphoheptulonate synthase [Coxiella sp. (in: Bacteria)]|nr:MAG: 3-deoxy-7-phosphoheptulonate synthase [Coxiella sp. (in: g-proteobacteria)]
MILILKHETTGEQAIELIQRLQRMGFRAVQEQQGARIAVAIVSGIDASIQSDRFVDLPYVDRVEQFSNQFKLAGNDLRQDDLVIDVAGKKIGGDSLAIMAGPCSIETEEQIHRIAKSVAASGAQFLRGGAFKPRTSPYDFQGLGADGLKFMSEAARKYNLASVSEIMEPSQIELAIGKIDMFQVGARNMQNYNLLRELGRVNVPILLKRGLSAMYKEWLMAAEYILNEGNPNVVLCERGIRTFESYTRNTLDLNAVPLMKELSHLPVVVDPSHGTGIRSLVAPMSCASVAAGADGVIIEVHYDPDKSYSDAQQAMSCEIFEGLVPKLNAVYDLCN